jgi:hypothetical protein
MQPSSPRNRVSNGNTQLLADVGILDKLKVSEHSTKIARSSGIDEAA